MRALEHNGSGMFRIEMNPERDYLSITIPIHEYFLPKKSSKNKEYNHKVKSAIASDKLTITEIAYRMGYKGISKKLRNSIDLMYQTRELSMIVELNEIRYYNPGK